MIQYIIHLTYLEWISSDKSDSNLFLGYSLLDVLGLDSLEAVVGGVEGSQEEPHKRVDWARHLRSEIRDQTYEQIERFGIIYTPTLIFDYPMKMQEEYYVIHGMCYSNGCK